MLHRDLPKVATETTANEEIVGATSFPAQADKMKRITISLNEFSADN